MGLREALRLSAQKTHFYGILKILRQKNQEGVKLHTQFGHKNADLENDYFLSSLFLTLVVRKVRPRNRQQTFGRVQLFKLQ